MSLHLIDHAKKLHITVTSPDRVVTPDCRVQERLDRAPGVGLVKVRQDPTRVRNIMTGIERGRTRLVNLRTMTTMFAKNVDPILVIVIEAVGPSFLQIAPTQNQEREIIMRWKWTAKLKFPP